MKPRFDDKTKSAPTSPSLNPLHESEGVSRVEASSRSHCYELSLQDKKLQETDYIAFSITDQHDSFIRCQQAELTAWPGNGTTTSTPTVTSARTEPVAAEHTHRSQNDSNFEAVDVEGPMRLTAKPTLHDLSNTTNPARPSLPTAALVRPRHYLDIVHPERCWKTGTIARARHEEVVG